MIIVDGLFDMLYIIVIIYAGLGQADRDVKEADRVYIHARARPLF